MHQQLTQLLISEVILQPCRRRLLSFFFALREAASMCCKSMHFAT